MTDTERINRLEIQMENLQNAYLQSQRNLVPTTSKVDETANKVVELTPYTETKTAYIDDTEVIFENVPQGNLTVYFDKPYTVERMDTRVVVKFEALDEVKDITISIN